MQSVLDLEQYPLDRAGSAELGALVESCKSDLTTQGLVNLPGFMVPVAIETALSDLRPKLATAAFTHARRHNIYFKKEIPGLAPSHPALQEFETSNQTVCADQMGPNPVIELYEWPPFAAFLARLMDLPNLFTMDDPLARVNVMSYGAGQALNWHFDRSEFTTTLLLQAPNSGGLFEYDRDLRSEDDPNYDGVADLLCARRRPKQLTLAPGTLNIFKGKNTAHRVTPVEGKEDRIIAVFSYYAEPGVAFSDEERIGFYGRAG